MTSRTDGPRWPNLFIVGAPKAGTTTLHDALAAHPEVFMSATKEPHYFSSVAAIDQRLEYLPVIRTESEYLRLFRNSGSRRYVGESSTSYLWDAGACRRISSKVPDGRVIALLRDPVARAYSHYLNNVREGFERRTFIDALREEVAGRFREPWHLSYIGCSSYPRQVERYAQAFGDALLVIEFERMVRDGVTVCAELGLALGLSEPLQASSLGAQNPYAVPVRGFGSLVFHNQHLRRLARRVTPSPARQAARKAVLRRAPKPELEPDARALLVELFGGMSVELTRCVGFKPSWDFDAGREATWSEATPDDDAVL
jgi:Sulfotransferase family